MIHSVDRALEDHLSPRCHLDQVVINDTARVHMVSPALIDMASMQSSADLAGADLFAPN
jgi:hypothetical protein